MSADPQRSMTIRITSNGKIKTWVSLALAHLEKAGDIPLVLHTLPAKDAENVKTGASPKMPPSVTTVPRLLTVVEIIKREFLKRLAEKRSVRLKGLHQYNEIGILEDLEREEDDAMAVEGEEVSTAEKEKKRAEKIVQMLSGTNHVKLVQTPYMRVTLSLYELPASLVKGATYQPPKSRKLSKSAKARAKKREKKLQEASAPSENA
ncbi:hypothetical protein CC1G_02655 [Coprinopsis cinerea okayama7|uniref:Uncharacterized protein n=1 Tax=Coprinopsis cinerea (strain Okayama-7 / 130 / ATCC MYA-4618 / FGSC 9003) TaxID=240176 RepID=A8PBI5_COPC7|nr:hypothetical protein CC1G_02655 [Coprinopsis cinerea okayama7\|eukprot:XP_001840192.2 hypothetical protein CC1G_02655 [Coprinopsis cinerea okayama7\